MGPANGPITEEGKLAIAEARLSSGDYSKYLDKLLERNPVIKKHYEELLQKFKDEPEQAAKETLMASVILLLKRLEYLAENGGDKADTGKIASAMVDICKVMGWVGKEKNDEVSVELIQEIEHKVNEQMKLIERRTISGHPEKIKEITEAAAQANKS